MELMTLLRNGVANFDLAVRQMKTMLPEELREPYINGVNACRNAGMYTERQILYSKHNFVSSEEKKVSTLHV